MKRQKRWRVGALCKFVLRFGSPNRAQVASGTISGTAKDSSRRVLALSLLALAPLLLFAESSPQKNVKAPLSDSKTSLVGPALRGTIRAGDGKTLEGVIVSARGTTKTFTTSVFTDRNGNYLFRNLESGQYRVWAQAVGYEAGRADLNLDSNRETEQNFMLKLLDDYSMQLTGAEWVAALPSNTWEERRMKEIFQHNCAACHTPSFVLQNRFDEVGWRAVLTAMEGVLYFRYDMKPDPIRGQIPYPEIHHFKDELAAYLAKMRGPAPSPMQFHPLPRPTGDAAGVVITEYDVPPAQSPDQLAASATGLDGSNWSEGTAAALGNQGTHDVVADRYGDAWISANEPNRIRTYAKIDTKTGNITNYRVDSKDGWAANTHGLAVGPDGIIWTNLYLRGFGMGEGGTASGRSLGLGRINPATGKLDIFTPPPGMHGGVGNFVDVDGKGQLWAVTKGGAIHYDPDTKKFIEFVSPSADSPKFSTYGLAGDADGNGWWADITEDKLGMGDIKTGKSREVQLQPRSEMKELTTEEDRKFYDRKDDLLPLSINTSAPWGRSPRRIAADHSGRYVWSADFFGQDISSVDIRSLKVTYYNLPVPYASAYDLTVDKNHMVWVTLRNADRVGKFDPETKKWTVYQLPTLGTECRGISVDRTTGEIWLASWRTSKVIRLQFRKEQQLAAATQNNGLKTSFSETKQIGKGLFFQRCSFCHLGMPTKYQTYGPLLDREVIAERGDEAVRERIMDGSPAMPGFKYSLKSGDVDSIVAYLKTVRREDVVHQFSKD
jgi:streptogramin lyase